MIHHDKSYKNFKDFGQATKNRLTPRKIFFTAKAEQNHFVLPLVIHQTTAKNK